MGTVVINPEDFEPDLDDLRRDQLHELGMPGVVADVLDDWLATQHGVMSSNHGVGAFLDELAAPGRLGPLTGHKLGKRSALPVGNGPTNTSCIKYPKAVTGPGYMPLNT